MTTTSTVVPALTAGTWTIDPGHSEVGFTVRHLMVSKVRGHFTGFSGTITVGDDALASSVEANIDMASVNTDDANRDAHLRSTDFFDTDTHPTMTYRSTAVKADGSDFVVDGELTLHGVTRPLAAQRGVQRRIRRSLGRHPGRVLGRDRDQPAGLRHRPHHAPRRRWRGRR